MWFGAVGTGGHTDVTVLGDTVNTTARLAAAAGAGEILVTTEVASQPTWTHDSGGAHSS